MSDVQEIERVVLALPAKDRVRLAEMLWDSLKESEAAFSISDAWRIEINRRCKEIDEGKVRLVPGEKVLRQARALIQSMRRRK